MTSSNFSTVPSAAFNNTGNNPAVDHYGANEAADHLVVKCVVVGDTAVGKSHLVCARAQGTKYTLKDLVLQTHISTIWAVDLYRESAEVRRRSRCEIDGVNCTLRMWDTFGNHDKNRQFSYSNADVVIVCFSAINRRTLLNVEAFWIPEVRRCCGMVPIIICCCQIDYRYLLSDPAYVKMEKGPFRKKIHEFDVVMPEEGRSVARKYGASYYETSVLAQYGIDDLFDNAIRSCLFQKRRSQIFSKLGYLKHVTKPHLQVPHLPPKPTPPEFQQLTPVARLLKPSRSRRDLQSYCDVTFVVGAGARLYAHWVHLIAASSIFSQLYRRRTEQMLNLSRSDFISMSYSTTTDGSQSGSTSIRSRTSWKSETNLTSTMSHSMWIGDSPDNWMYRSQQVLGEVRQLSIKEDAGNTDDEDGDENTASRLLSVDISSIDLSSSSQESNFRERRTSCALDPQSSLASSVVTLKPGRGDDERGEDEDQLTMFSDIDSGYNAQTNSMSTSVNSILPTAFVSIEVRRRENKQEGCDYLSDEETVIVVHDSIAASTFEDVLHYVYTGQLPTDDRDHFRYILLRRAAQKIGMADLEAAVANVLNKEDYLNRELEQKFQAERVRRIEELFLKQDFLADVVFQLDNGKVSAHRAFLMSRSDMMLSMFNLDFTEKSTNLVPFGGASVGAFRGLMTYLYTGQCPRECDDWASLIELADRLCLTGLLNDVQLPCVTHLNQLANFNGGVDATELTDIVLGLTEAAKLHKTEQVERWCHWYLQANFNEVVEKHITIFESLPVETRKIVIKNRWPPRWYLMEVEAYERALLLMTKQRPEASWLKRPNGEVVDPTHCFGFLRRRKQP